MNSFDWNGGIRGDCDFCGEPGFVYHNASLNNTMAMCDACRDDIDRRKASVHRRSADKDTVAAVTISRAY